MAEPARAPGHWSGKGHKLTAELACVVMSLANEAGLASAVQSLLDQDEDVEVVVVNSGGGGPQESLAAAGIAVPVIDRPERLYPGAVRNLGIEHSRARYVAFLEADCIALPGWAAGRLREHRAGLAAVACIMTNAYTDNANAWAAFLLLDHGRTAVTETRRRLLYGLSLDRELFERYGRFREDLRAAEDTEFRERLAGEVPIAWAADVVSGHRYPQRFGALISDAFRRGRLQAAVLGLVQSRGPLSVRVAYWGLAGGLQAMRIIVRVPKGERRVLLRAWPRVLPASLAFAGGALTARFRPYDGKLAAPSRAS